MVDPVDLHDSNYLKLYIDQLNKNIDQMQNELREWKNRHSIEIEYLKKSYTSLQKEYSNYTKDSIKRIDDKFNRIMFYLEEKDKTPAIQKDIKSTESKEYVSIKKNKQKVVDKQKKGWVFQMYRM